MAAPLLKLFDEPAPVTTQSPSGSWRTANTAADALLDSFDNSLDEPVARPALVAAPAQFALAGKAFFTLRSTRTGTRYTYRVVASDRGGWFVALLVGPDNWDNYQYLGFIGEHDRKFRLTAKSRYKADSTPVRAFAWTWERIMAGRSIEGVELWHEGKCGKCGAKLTVPESIARGFGPECAEKVGL